MGMKLWGLPNSYFGASWDNYYVFLSQNRDSDDLTKSNFAQGLAAVEAVASKEEIDAELYPQDDTATVTVVRENHWACGWVEWIAIHKSDAAAVACANELLVRLDDYPVLDEEDFGNRESETANETWRNCYDVAERKDYIREHSSQFDFHSLREMIKVLKGEYFNGYASELIG